MHCSTCPGDRQDLCRREGCYAKLCELRHATVVVDDRASPALRTAVAGLSSLPPLVSAPAAIALADLGLQVKRLDVESGDILVVRTAKKLTRAEADAIDSQVSQLARRHGVRDVSVMVLDNATDLTVERPGPVDTRMQHQAPRAAPIVSEVIAMRIMVPAGDTPTCSNCRFYAAANSRAGECRRSAPDLSDDSRRASWPILVSSDWCGEFEPRLVPAAVSQDQ